MADLSLIGLALAGALIGGAVGLVPGLHIYNVAGLALLWQLQGTLALEPAGFAFLLIGLMIGWLMCSLIPNVLLFAPDDGFANAILPATKLVLQGRGMDALFWMALGTLCTLLLLAGIAPALELLVRPVQAIIQQHAHWMLLAVTAFMVLGEWPRVNENQPPLKRLRAAWAYLGAGLLTFLLSGLLGLVLMTRSPIPIEAAYQNLMPAFVGLFTLPGLLQAATFGTALPPQRTEISVPTPTALLRASVSGLAGGGFAAVMPVISAGIGGLLAGHATAQRGEQQFMIGQGATRAAYFGGGLLLLFVPGLGLVRGGMSWMLSSIYAPTGWPIFLLAIAAIAASTLLSFVMLSVLAWPVAQLCSRLGPRLIAATSAVIALCCVLAFTGAPGLIVAALGMTIGLIPTFVGGRRLNCLGVLLVPIVLNMNGWQGPVAGALGL